MSIPSGTGLNPKEQISNEFPYRNSDGSPAFWHYQKDVIEKSLEAFKRGKRCVVVDAPVGSGKSVINYTILKCQGPAVYITAQKTLQDQIDNEDWPGVKSVKGRNAYTCNHALKRGVDHSCDIHYEDIGAPTCREMVKYNYELRENTYLSLIDSILKTIEETKGNRVIKRSRTSFYDSKEVFSTVSSVETMAAGSGKDPKSMFIKLVACNISPVECPVKSARLMARLSKIAVVNPDAFYALNKAMQLFEGRAYMVVDEAHKLDDAVQRMFRIKIPLGIFRDCLGINLDGIASITGVEEFCKAFQEKLKNEIWPLIAALKTLSDIEECFEIHNMKTYSESRIKDRDVDSAIGKGVKAFGRDDGFCLLSVFISAIQDDNFVLLFDLDKRYESFKDLYDIIRNKYSEECEKFNCKSAFDIDKHFIPKMSVYFRKIDKYISRFDNVDLRIEHSQKSSYKTIQSKIADHLSSISEAIENEFYVLDGMVRSKFGDNRVFIKKLIETTKEQACNGTQYQRYFKEFGYGPEDSEVLLDIIPLHIGCLLQNLIFRGMETIILSSGTWPDPVGMLSGYGFKRQDIEVLRIKPIFPAKNRPIYVNTNPNWTDFSERASEGGYIYQTEAGAKKFNDELYSLISYIRQKHGKDTNVAVHCFNYSISKLIGEYYPSLNDSFLIHLPRIRECKNKINGYTSYRRSKEELISMFCKNPKTGLTLISPSILEGLDFKEDICRAQIILKAPIPNLGDWYNYYKFNGCPEINLRPDSMFLDRKCAIDLNQAYGRNVRGMNDWGETYIMDLAISKRLAKAFKVHIDGLEMNAPGNMGKMNMLYIQQGLVCSKDQYGRFNFKWPI
jgi:Rad3-related DNA helicase